MPADSSTLEIDLPALWAALSKEEQDDACLDIWVTEDSQSKKPQAWLIAELAKTLRFRLNTFAALPPESKAKHLRKRINTKAFRKYCDDLLRAWLLERKRSLLVDFMEGAGLPHDNGMLDDTDDEVEPPDAEVFVKAITGLGKHPQRDLALYLGYLIIVRDEFWENLPEAVADAEFPIGETLKRDADAETSEENEEETGEGLASVEDNESFTTLDNTLIQLIVASAFGEEGALNEEQTLDLVDEVVDLNAKRQRSVFHLGYFHAVFEHEFEFHFPGENEDRRIWYLCGALFGLLRRGRTEQCLSILNEHNDLAEQLSSATNVPCGAMVLPHLYKALINDGQVPFLTKWISRQLRELPQNKRVVLLLDGHEDAASMVRQGRVAEAGLILETIDKALRMNRGSGPELIPKGVVEFLEPRNARKRAQISQHQGNLSAARSILEELDVTTLEPITAASVLADLGLIDGKFRSLQQIVPKADPNSTQALRDALEKGREKLEEATDTYAELATNAHFALGILELLRDDLQSAAAADHLNQALGGMLRREEAYRAGALIDWTRFCLGLALLEGLEESDFLYAAENVRVGLRSETSFPIWLWKRVLSVASTFEDQKLATEVAASLLEHRSKDAFSAIRDAGVLAKSAELRKGYLDWLLEQNIPLGERWSQLDGLLQECVQDGSCDLGETILDELERLAARDSELRKRFVELLEDPGRYSPVWETADAEQARTRFYEIDGNLAAAADILQRKFYQLRESGEPRHLDEARELVAALAGFRLPDFDVARLQELIVEEEEAPSEPAIEFLRDGGSVRVIYVGGNETQEAYEEKIRRHFKEKLPGLQLDFYFPGWDSGWIHHLDKIRPMIETCDALVLNPLVRTQFGRHVRRLCNEEHPWFACTGRGKKSLQRAIEKAALWAAARRIQ